MNVLENFINIDQKGNITYSEWIEWEHFGIPNQPPIQREISRILMALSFHCLTCTSLDGCYFEASNKPTYPQHEHCDCKLTHIPTIKVIQTSKATCDIRKFTEYVFTKKLQSKGKIEIFQNLGFSKSDSQYLQKEFCRQALNNYLQGNYVLKTLDLRGQRVAIPVTLRGKTFFSGWMVYPNGEIRNTTPFGGEINEKI